MENRKYVVCRNDIYVGEVVRTNCIHRYQGDIEFFRTVPGQLITRTWKSYRSMLFIPNSDKLSNDLLYTSPSYPILNITDDETCLNLGKNSIVIKDACNLETLLEYFGYEKNLTYEDIVKIRKTFFNGKFAMDNCKLFGYKEFKPEDWAYEINEVEVTDPKKLRKYIIREKISQKMGHRSFGGISEGPLPEKYWDTLDERGDSTLMDIIGGWSGKMNAFTPHRQEGPIKKLKRF